MTLSSLLCRDGARRVFTNQAGIANTKREGVLICCTLPYKIVWPLTTRPFRDGAPFPLLTKEAPPVVGRSIRFFHCYTLIFFFPILSCSCLAVCGHHLGPNSSQDSNNFLVLMCTPFFLLRTETQGKDWGGAGGVRSRRRRHVIKVLR